MASPGGGPHVLLIVQNLPVPLDRRTWLECKALRGAGYEVSVICPKGPNDPRYAVLDGIHVYKYRPAPPTSSALSYAFEFAYCWLRTAWLSLRVARRRRFDAIQACNPPDTYWLLARLWKTATKGRVRFVFDHHDLNPELFRSRYGEPESASRRLQLTILHWLERATLQSADHVISTNESYRRIAIERGGIDRERTTVVRSGPDTRVMRPVENFPLLRRGRRHLLVYLGIMGPQDGVDVVLRALHVLVHEQGRNDVHVALLGFGDSFDDLVELSEELAMESYVTFTGRADGRLVAQYLSSADIGLSPDLPSPLNNISTMNKTMEYMAFALPVVTFDLHEARVSAGDAALYVDAGSTRQEAVRNFAAAIATLLDDPDKRVKAAVAGRRQAERVLDWQAQRLAYVRAVDGLVGRASDVPSPAAPLAAVDPWGHRYVDLSDDALAAFVRKRPLPPRSPGRSVG